MVFTVLGSVAELERSLIAVRVLVGLRNTCEGQAPRSVACDRGPCQNGPPSRRGAFLGEHRGTVHLGVGEGTVYRMSLPDALSRPDLEMVALDYFRRLGHDNHRRRGPAAER